jgi:hypothetical protein
MKSAASMGMLCVTLLAATGCGSTMRDLLEHDDPQTQQAAVRQELTMPPDLRLPPPGSVEANRAAAPVYTVNESAVTSSASPTTGMQVANRAQYGDDVYTRAGIDIYKPDGTRKTDQELRKELQAYYTAQKRAQNPNYGTVFNMGNIFKDE